MDLPTRIKITRCSAGGVEIASIQTLNREDAKNLIDAVWWHDLDSTLSDPNDEPDRKWNWRQLISVYRNKPYFQAVCVLSDGGSIQAAMLYRFLNFHQIVHCPCYVNEDSLMASTHVRGVGDETPVTGGVSLPSHLVATEPVSGIAPDDDLGRRAFWLLTLHSETLLAELRSTDLSAMDVEAKQQLIAEIQDALGIKAFKSDVF